MPKVGTRSYTLIVEDRKREKSVAIEPPTEIQFDITMAMFTQLSIGHIKIYNPDPALKDFLMYKYSVGDERNRLFIELKPLVLGNRDISENEAIDYYKKSSNLDFIRDFYKAGKNINSYSYSMSVKAYVYQTVLMHPNAKDEYIHLQLLTSLWDIFSQPWVSEEGETYASAALKLGGKFLDLGYPLFIPESSQKNSKLFANSTTLWNALEEVSKVNNITPYIENDRVHIADNDPEKGKGNVGRIGSYDKPYEVGIDNGLMTYVQQVNNNAVFRFTLDHQFPIDSYVNIPENLINRQLVTPTISGGAGSLQWLLGAENKYRVLSYRLVGDYFDPNTWYQEVTVQAGNMPLAANLQFKAAGVS